jgi:uncharacterized protein (TIGR03546 family)
VTYLLKQIFALLKVLNSDTGENQIAAGLACGLVLGFAPAFSLQTVIIIVILFFFRIQVGAAMVASFFFALIAYLLDPAFDALGRVVLEQESLVGIFTLLFNFPIVPFTKFYNSIVMGSMVLSFLLFPIVFVVSKKLIIKYRVTVVARLENTKIWKAIKATALYKWYAKYNELYG